MKCFKKFLLILSNFYLILFLPSCLSKRERERQIETEKQRQRGRETERQRDKGTERQRQGERETLRDGEIDIER